MHAHSNPVGPQRTKGGGVDGVAWHRVRRRAVGADAPDLYELRRAVWWRVEDTAHTQHTQQRPKKCSDDAHVDGGDGDEGSGALVEKGQGRDELEQEGDEVERQKNSSATRTAHGKDDGEGDAADDNVGEVAEGMQRGEAQDATFHSDAKHPMALYIYPSNTLAFPHVIESAVSVGRVWSVKLCSQMCLYGCCRSRGDTRCHSLWGMVIVTAEGQGREQRKREMKKLVSTP
ncbi:hypothetical protein JB92DRAFT_2824809 [Gautieria morchelliformis]|nr:hypothetical protein JB92DRAFT_2824809 [Gautieria morchelliformis]